MSLATEKIELAKRILSSEDAGLINHIKAAFESASEDWYDHLPEDIKDSVTRGLKQSERGETISHDEVMKKYRK